MNSKEIRYKNARAVVAEVGGVSAFAERLGKAQSQASAIAGENPSKGIGHKVAREIEKAFNKPPGWLDKDHEGIIYSKDHDRVIQKVMEAKPEDLEAIDAFIEGRKSRNS